jgi:hypothetical protein
VPSDMEEVCMLLCNVGRERVCVVYSYGAGVCVTLSVCARDTIFAQVCVLYTRMELVCV